MSDADATAEPETRNTVAIDTAESGHDPLDGLVERTAIDPGVPFVHAILERLVALKKADREAFEALRAKLKNVGCRVAALDNAITDMDADAGGRRPTQADILIEQAQSAVLFHTPDGTGFADIEVSGHRETWPIRSTGFRRWLTQGFFKATRKAPNAAAMQSALNAIEAAAQFDALERVVHVRVGALILSTRLRQPLIAPRSLDTAPAQLTNRAVRRAVPLGFRCCGASRARQHGPAPDRGGELVAIRAAPYVEQGGRHDRWHGKASARRGDT